MTEGCNTNATCVMLMRMEIRDGTEAELDALAQLWFDAWNDAHASIVPAELKRVRTKESFRRRLHAGLDRVRVAGARGAPVGFSMIKGDELYQLFVAASARGSGVATALIADAEQRLLANGVTTAWLACAIGNDRAARFYEKHGWRRTGVIVNEAETDAGTFALDVWKYEKRLSVRL